MAIFAIGGSVPAEAWQVTASCNGTSTDAATIQNAINSSAQGDEITIAAKCLINATIELLGDRTYQGQNRTGTAPAWRREQLWNSRVEEARVDDLGETRGRYAHCPARPLLFAEVALVSGPPVGRDVPLRRRQADASFAD